MLVLTITRHGGQPPAGGGTRTFGAQMVTIGRGEVNDWVLPDPERLLSKRHCVINFRDGRYTAMDTSTNGLFVNGSTEAVGRGGSVPLNSGDRLEMGDYVIAVEIDNEAPTPGAIDDPFGMPLPDPARQAPPAPPSHAVSPPLSIDLDRDDPFHDPLAERTPDPWATAPQAADPPAFQTPGPVPFIPEDDDLFGPGGGESWQGGAQPDHVPAFGQSFEPPPAQPLIPDDWASDLVTPPSVTPAEPDRPLHSPVDLPEAPPAEHTQLPPSRQPESEAAPASSHPASSHPASPHPASSQPASSHPASPQPARPADGGGGLAAFLAGAGLEGFDHGGDDPDAVLRDLGAVFREFAEGLHEILAARATIKNEFRVERTMIGAADNNPLKFSPGGDEMLRLLLRPTAGYMPANRAVRDGVADMKAHQMASMAGMQAAVDALLEQFDPEVLKSRLDRQSLAGRLLPAARKARYWDLYEALYKDILKEVRDSFLGLFGREFARAYEEQSRKL
jgi:type VI secretion system protein